MNKIAQSKHLLADNFLGLIGHAARWFFCVPWIPKISPWFSQSSGCHGPQVFVRRWACGHRLHQWHLGSGKCSQLFVVVLMGERGKARGKAWKTIGKPWENNGEMYLQMMKWRFLAKFSSENGMKMDLLHLVLLKLHPGMDLPKSEF